MDILSSIFSNAFTSISHAFGPLMDVWFIIFPPLLFEIFKIFWESHIQNQYASSIKKVLLEIIPPRDSEKSPILMESIYSIFAGIHSTPSTFEVWIKGVFVPPFSLEIASIEGQVHFYVRTPKQFQNLVESAFYSQYPSIEIVEAEDYVNLVPRTIPNKEWDLWGTDFLLSADDLYPIKTYKYFEETVTGKMIDPLSGLIETMSKIGPGQHIWLQYIITPLHANTQNVLKKTIDKFLGKEEKKKLGIFGSIVIFFQDIITNIGRGIMGNEITFTSSSGEDGKDESPVEFRLTPGEKEKLKALESNIGKQMFRTRMRHVYVGRKEAFDKANGVSAVIGAIKQFNDYNLNGFRPDDNTKTYSSYLFKDERLRYRQRRIFRRYVGRDSDPQSTRFILSTEELATVFHIPDMSITTPSLSHISSKRGGAPINLPIQEE